MFIVLFCHNIEFEDFFKISDVFYEYKDTIEEVYKLLQGLNWSTDSAEQIKKFIPYALKNMKNVENEFDDNLMLELNNFLPDVDKTYNELKTDFDKVRLFGSKIVDVFDSKLYDQYKEKFGLEITNTGVKIKAPEFLSTLIGACFCKEECVIDLLYLSQPLHRNIPFATELLSIGIAIAKNNKDDLLEQIEGLIKICWIIGLSETQSSIEMLEDRLEMLFQDEVQAELMINGVVALTRICMHISLKNLEEFSYNSLEKDCENFCKILGEYQARLGRTTITDAKKQIDFILFIVGICRGEFTWVKKIAQSLGYFDSEMVREIVMKICTIPSLKLSKDSLQDFIQGTKLIGEAAGKAINQAKSNLANKSLDAAQQLTGMSADRVNQVSSMVSETISKGPSEVIIGAIFKRFDTDNSGFIDYDEFCELCKFLGLKLDKEKSLDLFAQADINSDHQITPYEFQNAMVLLKREVCYETLKNLGLTIEDLIWIAVSALIFLLLLFILIFLGISAFSQTSDFNSIVNSILPLAAGVVAASNRIDIKEYIEKVKSYVQLVLAKIRT